MTTQNTEHIDDDFLKKLVGQSGEDEPSPDFTEKVMRRLPKKPAVEEVSSTGLKTWHWLMIAAGVAGLVYFVFTFDLGTIMGGTSAPAASDQVNYLNMFGAVLNMFSQGFAAFEFTSVTLVIIGAGVLLFFIDRLLKKWSGQNASFA